MISGLEFDVKILDFSRHLLEELRGFSSVQGSVVICQRQAKVRDEGIDTAAEILRTGNDGTDSEYSALREIDDWSEPFDSEASEVGDCERGRL